MIGSALTANERRARMKKLCEFEIKNDDDRSDLMAILATAEYLVRLDGRRDYNRSYFEQNYFVVEVYEKEGVE